MSFMKRQFAAIALRPTTSYLVDRSVVVPFHSRSIANMATKASLKPAQDFLEFVNASPTRMRSPLWQPQLEILWADMTE
jgi:hypothetical protein